jgi:hypothetical protein
VAGIVVIISCFDQSQELFLRHILWGQCAMNEALVIAIMIATIPGHYRRCWSLCWRLYVVVGDYIRRRVAGLPPFEDDGSRRFVASS